MGETLVRNEPPVKADIIVVLAGDGWGNRILKASELASQGYAPKVLVSGPNTNYETWECDLAIAFAEKHGFPASLFVRFPNEALSTWDEAMVTIPELRRQGVRRFLLVTSDTHTRRAARIFDELRGDLQMTVVASPSKFFTPSRWWAHREGRKAVFNEWAKSVAGFFHL